MGTSQPHPGSGSRNPLIPAHADPSDPTPSPPASPRRLQAFRVRLGRFAASGEQRDLQGALKHFASTVLGGSATGARRFTAMAGVGADAILALRSSGGVAQVLRDAGIDLNALGGASIEAAIEALARALAPDDPDAEKVQQALRDAFAEVLQEGADLETFGDLSDEQQLDWIGNYLEGCVLQQMLDESGNAFDKAATPSEGKDREDRLRESIQSAIAVHLQPFATGGMDKLTERSTLIATQKAVIASVLASWEGWND